MRRGVKRHTIFIEFISYKLKLFELLERLIVISNDIQV